MISSSETVTTLATRSRTGGHVRLPSLPCSPSAIVSGLGLSIIFPAALAAAQSAASFVPAAQDEKGTEKDSAPLDT